MAKKKIKISKGPCPHCGYDEIFDKICFKCGKFVPKERKNKNENT